MNFNTVTQRIAEMRHSIIDEGILDEKMFTILEQQGGSTTNLKAARRYMDLYLDDAYKIMDSVEDEFEIVPCFTNFDTVETLLRRLKEKSASVGAQRVKNAADEMRRCLPGRDYQICKAAIANVKEELANMNTKLDKYLELKEQLGTTNSMMQLEGKQEGKKESKE